MISGLTKLLDSILSRRRVSRPMDEMQLEAAQDRLSQRSEAFDKSVDELGKMIRRMKRKQTGRKSK